MISKTLHRKLKIEQRMYRNMKIEFDRNIADMFDVWGRWFKLFVLLSL